MTLSEVIVTYAAGKLTEEAANKLLRELGTNSEIQELLADWHTGMEEAGYFLFDTCDDIFDW